MSGAERSVIYYSSTGTNYRLAQGKLTNKAVTAMTSASNPHGGQESTLLALYNSMYNWGAVIVPPGYTDERMFKAGGNPNGVSATATDKGEVTGGGSRGGAVSGLSPGHRGELDQPGQGGRRRIRGR